MSDGRDLFADFLVGKKMSRPVFVPFFDTLAAVISGVSYDSMISDPGIWHGALLKSAGLFDSDGLVAGFDPVIVAESLGAGTVWNGGRPVITTPAETLRENFLESQHLAAALETTRRMASPAGSDKACVAALVGPQTLARQVFGGDCVEAGMRSLKPYLATIAKVLLNIKPNLLMFVEMLGPDGGQVLPQAARVYNTLRNLAVYYDVPTALYIDGHETDTIQKILSLKMNEYILGCDINGDDPELDSALALTAHTAGVGIGVRLENTEMAREIIAAAKAACRSGHNVLITSLGSVDDDIDLQSARSMLTNVLN